MFSSKTIGVFKVGKNLTKLGSRMSSGFFVANPSIATPSTVGMGQQPSLVIFDKDGTLLCFHTMWVPWANYASESIEKSTGMRLHDEVANVLGLCTIENKVKPGLLAEGTMGQITHEIAKVLQRKGIKSDDATDMARASLQYSNDKTLSAQCLTELVDTFALFSHLKKHGTKIAVCTADNRKSSIAALDKMKVSSLVDMLVCGDDRIAKPKPHAHNALMICNSLRIDPSTAIMVGDTRVDIEMAHNARLGAAVGVLSGVGCRHHLHRADVLIDDVGNLVDAFYENNNA